MLTLPSGLIIYKSKFLPANESELACIVGPLGALDGLTNTISMSSCVRYLSNLVSNYASGFTSKIDFFPSMQVFVVWLEVPIHLVLGLAELRLSMVVVEIL